MRFADGALIIAPSFLRQTHRRERTPKGKRRAKREDKRNAHPESGGSTWRGCWSRRDPEHGCGGHSHRCSTSVPSAKVDAAAPLANFQAKGDNLVRLLAGAFDPAVGSLPAGSGIGLRDRSTLPADTSAVLARPGARPALRRCCQRCEHGRRADRRNGSWTTPTCAPRPRSVTRSLPTAQFAGPATTSPRGASRLQLPEAWPSGALRPAELSRACVLGRPCARRGRQSLEADERRQGSQGRRRRRRHRGDGRADCRDRCSPRCGVDRHAAARSSSTTECALGQRHRRARPYAATRRVA